MKLDLRSSATRSLSLYFLFFKKSNKIFHRNPLTLPENIMHLPRRHNRDEIRSANLALISGRQMHRINACIFLVAITKKQPDKGCLKHKIDI